MSIVTADRQLLLQIASQVKFRTLLLYLKARGWKEKQEKLVLVFQAPTSADRFQVIIPLSLKGEEFAETVLYAAQSISNVENCTIPDVLHSLLRAQEAISKRYYCPICDTSMKIDDDGDGISVVCPLPDCLFHHYAQAVDCGNSTTEERDEHLQLILEAFRIGWRIVKGHKYFEYLEE